MNPKVLLFDEPTSALDPDLRDHVAALILSLKKVGITQIIVTHDHTFAEKSSGSNDGSRTIKKGGNLT